jgi:hypothetical protein
VSLSSSSVQNDDDRLIDDATPLFRNGEFFFPFYLANAEIDFLAAVAALMGSVELIRKNFFSLTAVVALENKGFEIPEILRPLLEISQVFTV